MKFPETIKFDGARRMGSTVRLGGERERERNNRLRALHHTRPHTVGYIGGCDGCASSGGGRSLFLVQSLEFMVQ